MKKTCSICKKEKDLKDFHKCKNNKSGVASLCKLCNNARAKSAEAIKQRLVRYKVRKKEIIAYNGANRKKNWTAHQERSKKYYEANKRTWVEKGWKQKGILNSSSQYFTLEDYDIVLESQGGVCAICKSTGSTHKKGLVVDHNHSTGVYRGILCAFCNSGLGYFKDDPEIIKKAMNYITMK
jgi:hypothetical protein